MGQIVASLPFAFRTTSTCLFWGSVGMGCSRKKGEGECVKGEISTMVMTLLWVLPSHTATTVPHSLTGRDILAMFSDSGKGMSTR